MFDDSAIDVLLWAKEQACLLGHSQLETEDFLIGLLESGGNAFRKLRANGVTVDFVKAHLLDPSLTSPHVEFPMDVPLSPLMAKIIKSSLAEAKKTARIRLSAEDILLALINEETGTACDILKSVGVDFQKLRTETLRLQESTTIKKIDGAHTCSSAEAEFRTEFLSEFANILKYSLSQSDALYMIANILGKVLSADRCLIGTVTAGEMNYREYCRPPKATSCKKLQWPGRDSILIKHVLGSQLPFRFSISNSTPTQAIERDTEAELEMQSIAAKSFLGIQILKDEKSLGCLILQQVDTSRIWEDDEVEWLLKVSEKIASQLAT